MEDEPELTYWKPAPIQPPAPPQPVTPLYTPFPPGQEYLMPQHLHFPQHCLPPAPGLCYPVTDIHTFQHQQSGRQMTDNLIQEEVTRAAKTLFSKRNRTLMHWLNPDISMNQLKMEVNAAWESLPHTEKVFYISQVLGKFAPHTTSLMVNPQLDPNMSVGVGVSTAMKTERSDTRTESGAIESKKRRRTSSMKARKPRAPKQKVEYSSDGDASCDSGLVMDMDRLDGQRVKRKYTKRKVAASSSQGTDDCSSSCTTLPVAVENIKVEPGTETIPRVKRKYVKRKLVRKKYKKREPKNKSVNDTQEEVVTSSVPEPQSNEETGVWFELDDSLSKEMGDFKLSSEEVDNFWANIDDPSKFFIELEIE